MKVFFAVDGSPGSLTAVQQAGQLLNAAHDEAILYFAPPEVVVRHAAAGEEMRDRARQAISDVVFAEAKSKLPPAVAAKVTILAEHTAAEGIRIDRMQREIAETRANALDALIDRELILIEFTKIGGVIKPQYVDDQINNIVREAFKGDRDALVTELAKAGMSIKKFRDMQEKNIIASVMRAKKTGEMPPATPKEVEEYYSKNVDKWRVGDQVKISTISIPKFTGEPGATPESQKKLAQEIRSKLLKGGDFATLARSYSQDSRAEFGGAWEWMGGFLNIRIFGLMFLYSLQMQNAFLISLQPRYLVLIAIIQSGVNLFLDYGLIFGHFGLPALGFNGAAYASVISELIGMLTVAGILHNIRIKSKFGIHAVFKIHVKTLKLVFKQGFPLMSQLAISTGAWWVFFILVSRNYTYDEQAVSQSMRNLFGLGGVFSWAFGSSANTILSNLIGQGRQDEIFKIIGKMCYISVGGMTVFVLILNLFPNIFLGLFGQDGDFVVSGTGPLRIVSAAMIILCVGVIWLNAVVATGKTQIVFWGVGGCGPAVGGKAQVCISPTTAAGRPPIRTVGTPGPATMPGWAVASVTRAAGFIMESL